MTPPRQTPPRQTPPDLAGKIAATRAKQHRPKSSTAPAALDFAEPHPHDPDDQPAAEAAPAPAAPKPKPTGPPPQIPEHLRRYLVTPAGDDPRWADDYDHNPDALADDGKTQRYPAGLCTRFTCWPCTIARLDAATALEAAGTLTGDALNQAGRTWPGAARMAAARRGLGLPLDRLDVEALKRADPEPKGQP